jgi:hypothetical protein
VIRLTGGTEIRGCVPKMDKLSELLAITSGPVCVAGLGQAEPRHHVEVKLDRSDLRGMYKNVLRA